MPMMVHIATAPPSLAEVLDYTRPGDILTHCFTGQSMKIIDDEGKPLEVIRKAIDRGVIPTSATARARSHKDRRRRAGSRNQSACHLDRHPPAEPEGADVRHADLPSKLLLLGYSLGAAIELATAAPARILQLEGRGTPKPGAYADIALFHLLPGEFPLYDIANEVRTGKHLLVNAQTIVGGRPMVRRPAPSRPDWFDTWANSGTVSHIIAFQHELAKRGHGPAALARACGCEVAEVIEHAFLGDPVHERSGRRGLRQGSRHHSGVGARRRGDGGLQLPPFARCCRRTRAAASSICAAASIPAEAGTVRQAQDQTRWVEFAREEDPLASWWPPPEARHGRAHLTNGTHSTVQASANLDCAVQNAFGDAYITTLCPANPDVRAYLCALNGELNRYDVQACWPRVSPSCRSTMATTMSVRWWC
jgi:hypothetical protein